MTFSKINIYDDIIKNVSLINAWTNYDCLPVNRLSDKSFFDNIGVIEIIFDGTHGIEAKYNELVHDFHGFLERFLYSQKLSILRYEVSEKALRNKIRSYKGMYPKTIDKDYVIQKEFDLDSYYSIMAGLIKVTQHNNLIWPLFRSEYRCLVLSNDNNIFSTEALEYITTKLLNQSSFVIDYVGMCINYCKNGNIIIRENGDGGDSEFTWQIFVEKKEINNRLIDINTLAHVDL